mmetsp:Transcript_8108/g.14121  ORF Transcript_8108/g.14121 Transcript_8108/m.14121 type:complete len:83 (+) Transcript_8108:96-344(+)
MNAHNNNVRSTSTASLQQRPLRTKTKSNNPTVPQNSPTPPSRSILCTNQNCRRQGSFRGLLNNYYRTIVKGLITIINGSSMM